MSDIDFTKLSAQERADYEAESAQQTGESDSAHAARAMKLRHDAERTIEKRSQPAEQ
jgi:hypothetical protein